MTKAKSIREADRYIAADLPAGDPLPFRRHPLEQETEGLLDEVLVEVER
jgi:hypothetical protein